MSLFFATHKSPFEEDIHLSLKSFCRKLLHLLYSQISSILVLLQIIQKAKGYILVENKRSAMEKAGVAAAFKSNTLLCQQLTKHDL